MNEFTAKIIFIMCIILWLIAMGPLISRALEVEMDMQNQHMAKYDLWSEKNVGY